MQLSFMRFQDEAYGIAQGDIMHGTNKSTPLPTALTSCREQCLVIMSTPKENLATFSSSECGSHFINEEYLTCCLNVGKCFIKIAWKKDNCLFLPKMVYNF